MSRHLITVFTIVMLLVGAVVHAISPEILEGALTLAVRHVKSRVQTVSAGGVAAEVSGRSVALMQDAVNKLSDPAGDGPVRRDAASDPFWPYRKRPAPSFAHRLAQWLPGPLWSAALLVASFYFARRRRRIKRTRFEREKRMAAGLARRYGRRSQLRLCPLLVPQRRCRYRPLPERNPTIVGRNSGVQKHLESRRRQFRKRHILEDRATESNQVGSPRPGSFRRSRLLPCLETCQRMRSRAGV